MAYFSVPLTPHLGNRPMSAQTKNGARVGSTWDHSFPFREYLFLWWRILFSSLRANVHVWEMFCFLQMYEANEKSFRSIRANERTRCSARLRPDWSRPIEQGEITLPHLLRTTVQRLLASFVFSNRQLACYVALVSARFSQVTNSKHWLHVFTVKWRKWRCCLL